MNNNEELLANPFYIPVLGDGFVRLVSYMQPAIRNWKTTEEAKWTGDLEVVRNARVSHDADWRTGMDVGKDERLIRFMMQHHHTSPFEAMVFTFEVKAPIFVVRQWHRHRTWSYNELSGRYAELDEGYYVPHARYIGKQSGTNKQKRDIDPDAIPRDTQVWAHRLIEDLSESVYMKYREMLNLGIPREVARIVLPLNTYTRFFATVDLHNLFHFIALRDHEGAQWEMQQYAKALLQLIQPIVPACVEEFQEVRTAEEYRKKELEELREVLANIEATYAAGGTAHELAEIAQNLITGEPD